MSASPYQRPDVAPDHAADNVLQPADSAVSSHSVLPSVDVPLAGVKQSEEEATTRARSPQQVPQARPVGRWLRFVATGVGVAAVAAALRWVLHEQLGANVPYILYFPAIVLSTWLAGAVGGIACLVACGSVAWLHLMPALPQPPAMGPHVLGFALYILVGSMMVLLMRAQMIRRQQAESAYTALRTTETRERHRIMEFEALIEAMPSPMWISHDPHCERVTGNHAADKMLGVARGDNVAGTLQELFERGDLEIGGVGAAQLPMQRAVASGEPILGAEMSIRCADGTMRHVLGNAVPLRDDHGEIRGCLGSFVDITDRKNVERRMAFEHTVEHILASANTMDEAVPPILKVIGEWMNGEFAALWRPVADDQELKCDAEWVRPSEASNIEPFRLLSQQTRFAPGVGLPGRVWASRRSATIDRLSEDRNFPRIGVARLSGLHSGLAFPIAAGGEFFGVIEIFTKNPLRTDPALVNTMTSIGHDLAQFTRRRRAEVALRRSEAELEDFFDNAVIGLHWLGADGTILRANRAELDMIGYAAGEYVGRNIAEFHADPASATDMLARLARGETLVNYRTRLRCKDGSIKIVLIDSNSLWERGRFIHSRSFTRDITEETRAQATLEQSEARFRRIFECNLAPMGLWQDDGLVIAANDALLTMIGYSREHLQQKQIHLASLTPAEYVHLDDAAFEQCRSGEPCAPYEKEWLHKDGHRIPILMGVAMFDESEQSQRKTGVFFALDLTERKRAEAALASSADEYRAIFELAGSGKCQADPFTGRLTRVNRRLCEITGYSHDELLQRTFFDLTHPDDREADVAQFQRMVRGEIAEYSREKRYIGRNGRVSWVLVTTSLVRDSHGRPRHSVSVILDVTDRKSAEQELERHRQHLEDLVVQRTSALEDSHRRLRQSERLAALGTLSAGLGHDIGNLILPVMCRLDSLSTQTSANEQMQSELAEARQAVAQLRHMSNGLRLFAMDPTDAEASAGTTNLHTWWAQTGALLQRALPRRVRMEVDIPDTLSDLAIAPHQLTHAMLNVLTNAGEAIPDQGWVRITAGMDASGANARLLVNDTGVGMSEETRRHALEPFFTTKKRSLSTGLGLSLVHGLMQSVGGGVEIDSAPERGTTVTLTIPFVADPELPDGEAAVPVARIALRDPRVASYAHTLLKSTGFSVSTLTNGAPPDDGEVLWITEPDVQSVSAVREFLQKGPNRRVIAVTRNENIDGWNLPGIALVDGSYRTMRKALEQAWTDVSKGVVS